jgi:hypothetical protein
MCHFDIGRTEDNQNVACLKVTTNTGKKHPTVHNKVPSIFNYSVTLLKQLRRRKQGNKFQINHFFLQREGEKQRKPG